MTGLSARRIVVLRVAAQVVFFCLLVGLFLVAGRDWVPPGSIPLVFNLLDPLPPLLQWLTAGSFPPAALFVLVPVGLTLILGRFFCGWICPFGALHHFASWIMHRKVSPELKPSQLRWKYLVLAAIAVGALLGTSLGGWLDPFSLLTRSLSAAVLPAAGPVAERMEEVSPKAAASSPATRKQRYDLERGSIPSGIARVSTQPVLAGSILILLLGLNVSRRRLFCNVLCPLGALYGLLARFSLLRIGAADDCTNCRACARNCPYGGDPGERLLASECVLCFNCAGDCPREAVHFGRTRPWKPSALDVGRRRLLGAGAAGIAAALLPRASGERGALAYRDAVRPPGALPETEFLSRCVRCGQCQQACPTGFIQPAWLEAGVEGLWTPVVNARIGYCHAECNRCTRVCPSGAIRPLALAEKKSFKLGTALVDRNRCLTYSDGMNCTVCVDRCPVPGNAIRLDETEVTDYRGKRVRVGQIQVDPELCTGCGICEYVCVRRGAPGIFITSEEEARRAAGA